MIKIIMSKCVVIGVTCGIAVYKALDIISALRKKDVEVHVIMTESASKFVNPLTFQFISQNMVISDMFAEPKAWEIQHISLAQKADLIVIFQLLQYNRKSCKWYIRWYVINNYNGSI